MWRRLASPHPMANTTMSPASPVSLADHKVWSLSTLVAVVAVSTVIFGVGNAGVVAHSPLATLGANAALTAAIFGLAALFARLTSQRVARRLATALVLVVIGVLAAGRGAVLWFVMRASGIDNGSGVVESALISVAVFGTGFVLTVLAVAGVSKWRSLQTRLQHIGQQREGVQAFVQESIASHTNDVTRQLREQLHPQLDALQSDHSAGDLETLNQMIRSVVRPLSHALHREFPAVSLPPVTTVLVSAKEFLRLAIKGTPFAPILTGALFSLALSPRNLVGDLTLGAVLWTVGVGAAVGVGVWLITLLSQHFFTPLSLGIHTASLVGLLSVLGLAVAHLPALFDPEAGSPSEYYVVGPVATVLMAVLVGGVVNARRYLRWQEAQLSALDDELSRELSQARAVLWRRNQALATILHGSLQSTINSAAIKFARAENEEQAAGITGELANHIEQILRSLDSPDPATTTLTDTIANISATWEDITDISWQVEDGLVAMVVGTAVDQAIADCLVEAVYNAIKHQSPEKIAVTLSAPTPHEITLTVTHPGQIHGPLVPGLGTRILDYLTLRHSLIEKDGVVEFRGIFSSPTPHQSPVPAAPATP